LYTHWHTLTRTAKAEKLLRREPGPFIEVHPEDAKRLGLEEGEAAQVSSRRGTVQLPVRLNPGLRAGMVFVPFHWGDLVGEGNAANYLTISAIGRVAKQPELKFCAVSLEKVTRTHHREHTEHREVPRGQQTSNETALASEYLGINR